MDQPAAAAPVNLDANPEHALDPQAARRLEQHRFRASVCDAFQKRGVATVLAEVTIFSNCLQPHTKLMNSLFWKAGEKFDAKQARTALEQLEQLGGVVPDRPRYDKKRIRYRLEHAYDCEFEEKFEVQVFTLMRDTDAWAGIPAECYTQENQNNAFIVLSRSLCRNSRMRRVHKNYPYKLLCAPWHPELWQEINDDSLCPKRLDKGFQFHVSAFGLQR